MDSITLIPPWCLSHVKPLNITRAFFDILSEFTYDGEGEVSWSEYLAEFYVFLENANDFYAKEVRILLLYSLHESTQRWCCSIPPGSVHSLEQLCDLIGSTFHHFYLEPIDQKLLQQRKAPHESPMEFWECFRVLQFQAPKSQMKFPYLWDRFEYCLNKSVNPKKKFKIKPHSTYFGNGATQSRMNTTTVTSECLTSPHQATPPS